MATSGMAEAFAMKRLHKKTMIMKRSILVNDGNVITNNFTHHHAEKDFSGGCFSLTFKKIHPAASFPVTGNLDVKESLETD